MYCRIPDNTQILIGAPCMRPCNIIRDFRILMYKLNFRSTFPTGSLVLYVKAVLYLLFHYQEIHGYICKTCLALTMFNIKDVKFPGCIRWHKWGKDFFLGHESWSSYLNDHSNEWSIYLFCFSPLMNDLWSIQITSLLQMVHHLAMVITCCNH